MQACKKYKSLIQSLRILAVGVLTSIAHVTCVGATETYLAPGDTQVIHAPHAIDTIFI